MDERPYIINVIIEFAFTEIAELDSYTLSEIDNRLAYPLDLEYGKVIPELQKIASKLNKNNIKLLSLVSYRVPPEVAITGYSMRNYHNYQFRVWSCVKSGTIDRVINNSISHNQYLWRAIVGSLEHIPNHEFEKYIDTISQVVNQHKYTVPNCTADSLFRDRIREICPYLARIHSIPATLHRPP